ncbi:MAG: anti-sigma factor domain-containing protein [Streptosporangiaceae bacterium]
MKLSGITMRRNGAYEPHTLAGAYAMDAISPPDRARFERHLEKCDECAREVDGLREATARLAAATAASPPAGLKERVMTAAAQTRQQPPKAPAVESKTATASDWLRSINVLAWPNRLALAGGALAVAMLALLVTFGVNNGSMQQQLDDDVTSSQQIAAVLTAKDAHMITGQVLGGGTVDVVVSSTKDALVFTAKGLRPLPSSRGYELWLVRPTGTRPVEMLPPQSDDMISPVIATGLRDGDHLVLTAEPVGGSAHPDKPMMLNLIV